MDARNSPLRELRLSLPMPATLDEVATWVRMRGLRCTVGHLSAVERGLKPGGAKLRAVLGLYYGKTPTEMRRIMDDTGRMVRARKRA